MNRATCNIATLIITIGILAIAGCAPTPPPTYFQLEEPASIQLSGIGRGVAVGVGPLNLRPIWIARKLSQERRSTSLNCRNSTAGQNP